MTFYFFFSDGYDIVITFDIVIVIGWLLCLLFVIVVVDVDVDDVVCVLFRLGFLFI